MVGPRDNTRNLRLNKPGLFTPTVVRGMRQGPSNNSVNFGRSSNTLADSSINSTSSFKYTVDGTGLRNTQQLNIDWCFAPDTLVLTADLEWKPISTLIAGQSLIGFDENLKGCRKTKYRLAVVEQIQQRKQNSLRIITDKGEII